MGGGNERWDKGWGRVVKKKHKGAEGIDGEVSRGRGEGRRWKRDGANKGEVKRI